MGTKIADKFAGCLLGGLIGDCFGAPFESAPFPLAALLEFLAKKLANRKTSVVPILLYTDDTEMTRSVAESLIVRNEFDAEDMAQRFAEEYFEPNRHKRGYGAHVTYVFKSLKERSYSNVFDPAKIQFYGAGSLGNGGAMRTHPVALFCYDKSQDALIDLSRQVAQLTHAHLDGYNGAILQTLAVRYALEADPSDPFDASAFLEKLNSIMEPLESGRPPHPKYPSYCTQIENIKSMLEDNSNISPIQAGERLGNQISSPLSVPVAIYCFLRCQSPVEEYETTNPFLRTLFFSIAVGGDTDTIACMACSIAGAFYGKMSIPELVYEQCEAYTVILEQAERLGRCVGLL